MCLFEQINFRVCTFVKTQRECGLCVFSLLARLPKSQVSFEKERYKDRALFDKSTRILGRLLIFSTPYLLVKVVCGQGVAFQRSKCVCVCGGRGGNTSPPLGGKGKRPAAI